MCVFECFLSLNNLATVKNVIINFCVFEHSTYGFYSVYCLRFQKWDSLQSRGILQRLRCCIPGAVQH